MNAQPESQAVRRLTAELKNLENQPDQWFYTRPLPHNILEWHFTVRGPLASDFEGGFFHGILRLPANYPYKGPQIVFTSETGRFVKDVDIVPTIFELMWTPALTIQVIMHSVVSAFTESAEGCPTALEATPEERQAIARESLEFFCPDCGQHAKLVADTLELAEAADSLQKAQNRHDLLLSKFKKTHTQGGQPPHGNQGGAGMMTE